MGRIIGFDDAIDDIVETLGEYGDEHLARVAAGILAKKVKCLGGGRFKVIGEDGIVIRGSYGIVEDVREVLTEADGGWLAEKYAAIVAQPITYLGDSLFAVGSDEEPA